jgi:hypothetical protein
MRVVCFSEIKWGYQVTRKHKLWGDLGDEAYEDLLGKIKVEFILLIFINIV